MDEWVLPVIATLVVIGVIYFASRQDASDSSFTSEPTSIASDATVDGTKSTRVIRTPNAVTNGSWHAFGVVAVFVGAGAFAFSLFMKTSVSAPGMFGGSDEVVNIGLQHQQGMLFNGGLFAIGLGVFCIAVGAIINAISSRD